CLQSAFFESNLLPQLKKMFFCGETLARECAAHLFDRFPGVRLFNAYGPTEATVAVTAVEITRDMTTSPGELPVGYVKDGCKILFSPDNNEIEIVGDSVAAGYLGAAGASGEKFFTKMLDGKMARGYRTGDTGWFADGLLYYGGRLDNQVKLHGYRVEMEDIENNIKKLPFVKNAVVLPQKEGGAVSRLTAVVVPREHLDGNISQMVKSSLKEMLPAYMVPHRVVEVSALPMNANGKIDRNRLAEEL
ncbi:MAG: AMP-binding protein, partial [Eubacteriales bacterium]